ncbi:MAG: major capsid protein [Inconstantimicrobium porci]|uniref:major capsid protein n=1 Tax=Inconstantimicrobium porci TaxID=2652291 RepID=UPI002A9129B8|nr:major capsid protein [Inconstantimicrobium porci]MDY5913674.1 major capsid protein [Inconstantimicrobium porci]
MARSLFDLSHLNSLTIDNAGSLIPIACKEVNPNEDHEISVKTLLRVLPQVVPLYSRQRLYIYAFYSRACDLWKDAHAYYKKGWDGNLVLNKPKLTADNMPNFNDVIKPESLADYLGLPIGYSPKTLSQSGQINCLPFFMYEKIYQAYFMEKNLYIKNRAWLPNDNADLRIGSDNNVISNSYETTNKITLGSLHFRNYPQDYFTSCVPSPTRGNPPPLKGLGSIIFDGQVHQGNSVANTQGVTMGPNLLALQYYSSTDNRMHPGLSVYRSYSEKIDTSRIPNLTGGSLYCSDGTLNIPEDIDSAPNPLFDFLNSNHMDLSLTLDSLRHLAISTEELERMARTDGSYIDFGLTFFGDVCKNALDYRPILFGATYQSIAFSEVLQTGSSTENSPLGAYAGHGISVTSDNGYLGKIHTDDYGYIMIIASIMPDVYYSQGIDKMYTKSLQSEEFLPNRSKMGLIPVLNKELYATGIPDNDNGLFAYQNPFDEFRYEPSHIHGKIADPSNLSFFPYTQSRKFTSVPTYSQSFFSADKVRKDYLAGGTAESAYTAQFSFNWRAVRPLPYIGVPATIIN